MRVACAFVAKLRSSRFSNCRSRQSTLAAFCPVNPSATGSASITTSGHTRAWITKHPRGCICPAAREDDEFAHHAEGTFFELGALPPSPGIYRFRARMSGRTMQSLERRIGQRRDATRAPSPAPEWGGAAPTAPNSQPKRHAEY